MPMSKYMRLIVMFDLPTGTAGERRAANQFRHFLLHDGYYMMQFSIYVRLCNGQEAATKHRSRLLRELPEEGSVRTLLVTERQFEAMEILCGEKIPDLDEPQKESKLLVF